MSLPTGPYGPKNNLGSQQAPEFGKPSPMKSSLAPLSQVGMGRGGPAPPAQSFQDKMMEFRPAGKQHWQQQAAGSSSRPITLDDSPGGTSTADQSTRPAVDIYSQPFNPYGVSRPSGFTAVNGGRSNNIGSSLQNSAPIRKPTGFIGGYGGMDVGVQLDDGATYYGGDFMDTKQTEQSLKNLFESSMNDAPPRRRTRKQKKDEEDALAKAEEGVKEEEEEEFEEEDGSVDGLNVTLLPHQIRGLDFLLSRENPEAKATRGGLLADDMGLGKTVQSIALILSNPFPTSKTHTTLEREKFKLPASLDKGTLIIAPLALTRQWEGEIKSKTDGRLKVLVHHGANRTKSFRDLKKYDVVITTPQILVSEHKDTTPDAPIACFGIYWWRIIIDEAHGIKNSLAKQTLACYALNARYRWCLTGTPLQNNVDELQSLLHFLRIEPLGDKKEWKEKISRLIQNNRGGVAIKRLQAVLSVIMLRRTKKVLQAAAAAQDEAGKAVKDKKTGKATLTLDMVNRTVVEVQVPFQDEEQRFYTNLETRMDKKLDEMLFSGGKGGNMTGVLVLMMRLRQACNHPHLLAGKLSKDVDKEAIFSTQTPRKKKPVIGGFGPKNPVVLDDESDDADDLAAMLGGLTVVAKACDICQEDLTKDEIANNDAQCAHCKQDLSFMEKAKSKRVKKDKKPVEEEDDDDNLEAMMGKLGVSKKPKKSGKFGKSRRPVVFDSDDEEEQEAEEEEEEEEEEAEEDDDETSSLLDDEAEESSTPESDEEVEEADSDEESSDDDLSMANEKFYASTKIRQLVKVLRCETKAGNKTIVFSAFTSMLDHIEPFLRKNRMAYVRYDGSMNNNLREASLTKLRDDPRCKVLLCSLKCGALGLNLTAANRVVILEPFWNPFVEEQAIDRVHRIGQTSDVKVYKMTIENSIESRILELQNRKRAIADATFGEGANLGKKKDGAGKLNMKDMMFLFGRKAEEEGGQDEFDRIHSTKTNLLESRTTGDNEWEAARPVQRMSGKVVSSRVPEDPVFGRR